MSTSQPITQGPSGYIHPDNLRRLTDGETVAFRRQPYSHDGGGIPVFVGAPSETGGDLLRDALDHIMRTARASRTQTRRLLWIESRAKVALDGRPYVAAEHSLPPPSHDSELSRARRQNIALRASKGELANALRAMLDAFVDNPVSGADTTASAVQIARDALASLEA